MYAYLDQNFLIRCRDSATEADKVIAAQKAGKARLVLSPIHFYEAGTVREENFQLTVDIVERIDPDWCLSRADMQFQEFRSEWNRFWRGPEIAFEPIGDLAHVLSTIHRKPSRAFTGVSLSQAMAPFKGQRTTELFGPAFEMNRHANVSNRNRFQNGELTPLRWKDIERSALALQLARESERGPDIEDTVGKMERILQDPSSFARISIFIENGGIKRLRAHTVELLMTQDRLIHGGELDENNQVDRDHAVVALAGCEILVTDDRKLRNLCNRIRENASIELAKVCTGDEFIDDIS